jgi:ferritin
VNNVEYLRWLAFEGGSDVKRMLGIADKLEELGERDAVLTALEDRGVAHWEWYEASLEDAGL